MTSRPARALASAFPCLLMVAVGLSLPVAAEAPVVAEVAAGDADLGQALDEGRIVHVGYIDANVNGRLDLVDPDEPVYLDVDASRSISYGDLRLGDFHRYAAGSAVALENRDAGMALTPLAGWFARDGSQWYIDGDASGTVTHGDLRLGATVAKVRPGDPTGQALAPPASPKGALAWQDLDRNGQRGATEPLFLDTDPYTGGARKVSIGDLRIVPQGLGAEDEATREELASAVSGLQEEMAHTPAPPPPAAATTEAVAVDLGTPPVGWRALDWILVVVGVANLAGLVVVGRMASAPRLPRP